MAKWEYKEIHISVKQRAFKKPHAVINDDYIKILNDEGKKGWELVNSIPFNTNGHTYDLKFILKRQIITKEKSFF